VHEKRRRRARRHGSLKGVATAALPRDFGAAAASQWSCSNKRQEGRCLVSHELLVGGDRVEGENLTVRAPRRASQRRNRGGGGVWPMDGATWQEKEGGPDAHVYSRVAVTHDRRTWAGSASTWQGQRGSEQER
jgi:hypothetical protein